jgi:hypothetical protein
MAVAKKYEYLVETAFVTVLDANSDCQTVRAWKDASANKTYPITLVSCDTCIADAGTPSGGGLWQAVVNVILQTYNPDDTNKSALYNLVGASRDTLTGASILSSLTTAGGGLTFKAVMLEGGSPAMTIGDKNINQATITLIVKFY